MYDVAGQVEYDGLSELFRKERALYVLVWDASKFIRTNKKLMDYLKEWLVTPQLKTPHSTVLLCCTHKDKCLLSNLLTKLLAWLRRFCSIEEHPINENFAPVEGLKLEPGIERISSSPSFYCRNGLTPLQQQLKKCGKSSQWLIPQSWYLALVVLDAVRDKVDPVEAARRHINHKDPLPVESKSKRCWISLKDLEQQWKDVLNPQNIILPAKLKPDDPEFVLQNVMAIRERDGSLLKHNEGVFLDVEDFPLSLSPIFNHKTQEIYGEGACIFAGRKLEKQWQFDAKEQLVSNGILETRFAEFLWGNDFGALPEQIFDVLLKLGIILQLPLHSHTPGDHRFLPEARENTLPCREFLVLTRLPQNAPRETIACFNALNKLRADWGVRAKWDFSLGRTPHGLVERLIASCHFIGDVVKNSCWRRGACFVAHKAAINLAGGSFALSLQFIQSSTSKQQTAGTLVVQAFGHREGRAVWGALRFVISTVWHLLEEFRELSWKARVMCPKHEETLHFLAGAKDSEGRSPGDPIIRPKAIHHCRCQQEVASRLGTVLPPSSPLENVFNAESGDQGHGSLDGEEQFRVALETARYPKTEKASIVNEETEIEGWRMPGWVADTLFGGASGVLALGESWAPLFKLDVYWHDGAYAEAILLSLFATFMAVGVTWLAAVGFRKLRQRCRSSPRASTKND